MIGPNLSDWALKHCSFVIFAMIAVTIAGLASYFRLGRSEDPAFTFRTMIVQASWPGATLDDTLQQVTERLERKLQETKGLDYLRSYTSPGITTIFVNLRGSTTASEVPDIWYQVRKNIGDIRHTLPAGVIGPGFNDDFGDTYGLIYGFTADGFTHRELRDYVEDIRSRLLRVSDVSKIEILGAQDEQIFVEFSTQQLAGLGIVSLGFRPGAVVALSIPLTMAVIFPIMEGLGIDLQRISLGALIIALGLLVDDAMTTVDVMTPRLAAGDSKEQAATFAYKILAFPMLTGSFVTAAGFVPIGFARSAAGEYTFSIFAVVTVALIVSWFVAVLFAPLLGVWLLKKPETAASEHQSMVLRIFRAILVGAMRMRWLTIAVTLACFAASVLALPYVPRQFFPASDRPELVVDLTLPQNASIFASDRVASNLDAILAGDPDVASWSSYVGRGDPLLSSAQRATGQ